MKRVKKCSIWQKEKVYKIQKIRTYVLVGIKNLILVAT